MRADIRTFLFPYRQGNEKIREKKQVDVIRGINSRAIIVSSKLPPMFKQAIFILNDKYDASSGDILAEADKALAEYASCIGLTQKKSPVWPVIAAISTAAFILKLTGII